jgi:hypothetical protein
MFACHQAMPPVACQPQMENFPQTLLMRKAGRQERNPFLFSLLLSSLNCPVADRQPVFSLNRSPNPSAVEGRRTHPAENQTS